MKYGSLAKAWDPVWAANCAKATSKESCGQVALSQGPGVPLCVWK